MTSPRPESDLARLLGSLEVSVRPERFVFATNLSDLDPSEIEASIVEPEGASVVVTVETALNHGVTPSFVARWLTLTCYSALDAIGLTAAVTETLTDHDIACNVIAGFHHDHLLIPEDRLDDALAALNKLRADTDH